MINNLDIISEPEITKEQVSYIEVAFVGGGSVTATLHEGDSFEISAETMRIERNGEVVVINNRNVLWFSRREGVEETPVEQPTRVGEAAGDQSDSTPAHLRESDEDRPLSFYSGLSRPRKEE